MHRSLLVRRVVPAALLFAGLIAAAIGFDVLLHFAGLRHIGFWLGPVGTGVLALSFLYSLKKRKKIAWGQPRALLDLHQTLGWVGALLVMVHAGAHLSALLPWLALIAMAMVVASGITGGVLLRGAVEALRARQAGGAGEGQLVLDAATVDVMKRWRKVHMPLNAVFLVLMLAHVASILVLRKW